MFDSTGYHPVVRDTNWYDVGVVKKAFEFVNETYGKIDLIIVDGPGKRAGLFEIINNGDIVIDEDTEIIFDDCNREDDSSQQPLYLKGETKTYFWSRPYINNDY